MHYIFDDEAEIKI